MVDATLHSRDESTVEFRGSEDNGAQAWPRLSLTFYVND